LGENREECDKVGHVIGTRDVDICDDTEFPVISHGQSFSALNQPGNDICSDVADVFMWCQLVRQSTAAAADINDQIPLAQAQRAQQAVLEFADSFEFTTDCPSQGFPSAKALFKFSDLLDVSTVARILSHKAR
jgi:hypothetical protein